MKNRKPKLPKIIIKGGWASARAFRAFSGKVPEAIKKEMEHPEEFPKEFKHGIEIDVSGEEKYLGEIPGFYVNRVKTKRYGEEIEFRFVSYDHHIEPLVYFSLRISPEEWKTVGLVYLDDEEALKLMELLEKVIKKEG